MNVYYHCFGIYVLYVQNSKLSHLTLTLKRKKTFGKREFIEARLHKLQDEHKIFIKNVYMEYAS